MKIRRLKEYSKGMSRPIEIKWKLKLILLKRPYGGPKDFYSKIIKTKLMSVELGIKNKTVK